VEATSRPAPTVVSDRFESGLGKTVLVVDDDLDILEVAVSYLTEMGFTALQAKHAVTGLKAITEHGEIDLVVTDIVMPGGMNGVELAQRARLLRPSIKIIYPSGFPAEVLAKKTTPLVEGPLLRKPYQRSDFAQMIHRVMKNGGAVNS
jgi:CheY-like chemotaxis protein